jgi:hypothetical protein
MKLTEVERERITDSRAKLQSVARTLKHVDPRKVQDFHAIQDCLDDANKNLASALKDSGSGTRKH